MNAAEEQKPLPSATYSATSLIASYDETQIRSGTGSNFPPFLDFSGGFR
jgi:hypothetical protein